MAKRDKQFLAEAFAKIGFADKADDLAHWEIDSNVAELAKRLWLRMMWNGTVERWRNPATLHVYPQGRKLLDAGADPETLRLLCGAVALDTLAYVEHGTDYGHDPDSENPDQFPGWSLVEIDPDTEEQTGRALAGLHETGLEADPKRDEGREFWKDGDAPGIDYADEPSRPPHWDA